MSAIAVIGPDVGAECDLTPPLALPAPAAAEVLQPKIAARALDHLMVVPIVFHFIPIEQFAGRSA
jgi:hypothetical protein